MPKDEQKAIRLVLKELLRDGLEWQKEPKSRDARKALASGRMFNPLAVSDLDRYLLPRSRGKFEIGEAIQTRPPEREVLISSLWCKWDFVGERAACWFYIGWWLTKGEFAGFRFEPPGQGDNHDYYHSQPCRSMCLGGSEVHGALALPERNPTWPLPAGSSLDLLLCTIVSTWGMAGLQEVFNNALDTDAVLRQNRTIRDALNKIRSLRATSTL